MAQRKEKWLITIELVSGNENNFPAYVGRDPDRGFQKKYQSKQTFGVGMALFAGRNRQDKLFDLGQDSFCRFLTYTRRSNESVRADLDDIFGIDTSACILIDSAIQLEGGTHL